MCRTRIARPPSRDGASSHAVSRRPTDLFQQGRFHALQGRFHSLQGCFRALQVHRVSHVLSEIRVLRLRIVLCKVPREREHRGRERQQVALAQAHVFGIDVTRTRPHFIPRAPPGLEHERGPEVDQRHAETFGIVVCQNNVAGMNVAVRITALPQRLQSAATLCPNGGRVTFALVPPKYPEWIIQTTTRVGLTRDLQRERVHACAFLIRCRFPSCVGARERGRTRCRRRLRHYCEVRCSRDQGIGRAPSWSPDPSEARPEEARRPNRHRTSVAITRASLRRCKRCPRSSLRIRRHRPTGADVVKQFHVIVALSQRASNKKHSVVSKPVL